MSKGSTGRKICVHYVWTRKIQYYLNDLVVYISLEEKLQKWIEPEYWIVKSL